MQYNQHNTHEREEPGGRLSPEEEFVAEVFDAKYKAASPRFWVTSTDLYDQYKAAWNTRLEPYPGDPDPEFLSIRKFIPLLRNLFPSAACVRRRVDGRATRGVCGIIGPHARMQQKAGRPAKRKTL